MSRVLLNRVLNLLRRGDVVAVALIVARLGYPSFGDFACDAEKFGAKLVVVADEKIGDPGSMDCALTLDELKF
jgi:hypothetical protein